MNNNQVDLTPEFEELLEKLRREFMNCNNVSAFLLIHQKLSNVFTRKLQQQLDKIPMLVQKQVREININASPEAISLLNLANNRTELFIDTVNKRLM